MASVIHKFLAAGCPLEVIGTILPSRKPDYIFSVQLGVLNPAAFLEADHDNIKVFEADNPCLELSNIIYLQHWHVPSIVRRIMLHEGLYDSAEHHEQWSREYNRRCGILQDAQEQVIAELDTLKVSIWRGEVAPADIMIHIRRTLDDRKIALNQHGMGYVLELDEHGKVKRNVAARRSFGTQGRKKQIPEQRFGAAKFVPEPSTPSAATIAAAEAMVELACIQTPRKHKPVSGDDFESEESEPPTKRRRITRNQTLPDDLVATSSFSRHSNTNPRVITVDRKGMEVTRARKRQSRSQSNTGFTQPDTKKVVQSPAQSTGSEYIPGDDAECGTTNLASSTPNDSTNTDTLVPPIEHQTSDLSSSPRDADKTIPPNLLANLKNSFPFLASIANPTHLYDWYRFLSFFSHNSPVFRERLNKWFETHGEGGIRWNAEFLKLIEKAAGEAEVVGWENGERVYRWKD